MLKLKFLPLQNMLVSPKYAHYVTKNLEPQLRE